MADWPAVIGPALAAVTRPMRLSRGARDETGAAKPGTLTIRCAGPVALELQHLAPQLLSRINGFAGFQLVAQLRFERGSVAAPPAADIRRIPPAAPADESGLEAIHDPDLRAALAALRASLKTKER